MTSTWLARGLQAGWYGSTAHAASIHRRLAAATTWWRRFGTPSDLHSGCSMTVTNEKIQELHAVVKFWKFRVDETRRHLDQLIADNDARPNAYMEPLIEMKTRELTESQRGLRKAQAGLGRLVEDSGQTALEVALEEFIRTGGTDRAQNRVQAEALPAPEPEPEPRQQPKPARDRRRVHNPVAGYSIGEYNVSHRPSI
jgi:hypothetical protein